MGYKYKKNKDGTITIVTTEDEEYTPVKNKDGSVSVSGGSEPNQNVRFEDDDIAPTKQTATAKEEKKNVFERVGDALSDGYDFGDVSKAILGITDDSASLYDLTIGSAKRGYYNSRYGEESYAEMTGQKNEKDKFENILAGEEYQFTPGSGIAGGISGAFEMLGQNFRNLTNPITLGSVGTAVGVAALAGNAGPQALIPEEVITIPAAVGAGIAAGGAANAFKVEAGLSYNELLEAGVSKETASKVAMAVGGVNAGLELLQIDELVKSFKILNKSGATKSVAKRIGKELIDRGVDVAKETAQEVVQEGVTMAGTQIGSKIDNDEWAYNSEEVLDRLGDTAKSSALSFGLMNVPAGVKNTISITKDGKIKNKGITGTTEEQKDEPVKKPEIPEDEEKEFQDEKLTEQRENNISEEATGNASDETYFTMSYKQDGKVVGTLQYGDYNGEPSVKMIEVDPEYRRQGIGTKLLQELQKKYPDIEIDFGMQTPDGAKLIENSTYTVENKEVADKLARIEEIKQKLAKYDDGYNKYFENDLEIPENYAADYNELSDEMDRLTEETRGKKPTKTFVKTGTEQTLASEETTPTEGTALNPSSSEDLLTIAKQARRENFHGAYTENGKQYLSDGSFVAEFNTVDESLEQRADFPGKIATKEIAEAFERPAQGNFDIHEAEGGYVKVGNSLFDSKYVNAMIRAYDNPTFSIAKHRGGHEVLLVTGDNGRAVLMPVEAGENANVAYEAELLDVAPTAENTYPEDFAPITEDEANKLSEENLASLTDEDAPTEAPAPYYGEDTEEIDPFENRDVKEVGNKKVNAYMYDNPDVRPFFQKEAEILLGELNRGTKGERFAIKDQDGYIVDWTGTSRDVSHHIAQLLDDFKLSYKDIRKGLEAIIKDHGAENIAAAKRIEFVINERLMNGYYDDTFGFDVEPNQDYIKLLEAKHNEEKGAQVTAQGEEAFGSLVNDDLAPSVEDAAPAKKTPDLFETSGSGQMSFFEKPKTEKVTADVAPAKETAKPAEAYEAIRPEKPKAEPTPEPRMKRVDSTNNAPDGMEERSWYETSTSSKAVDGIVIPDDIPDEVRYYKVKANKDTLATANARLARDGYAKSREYFEGRMSEKKLTVEDIALGERLIQEAAKAGDAKAVRELIIDVSILGTELGQRVQALSMIRRLTPEGQLRALHRIVERGKTKGDPAFDGVEITDEMTETILETVKEDGTFDQKELDRAVEDVKQQIADQMKVTKMDKVNAWRYLAMLGNPKTHGRNIISNVAMFGTRVMKNAVARSVEDIALRKRKTDLNTEDIAPIANDADAANRTKDNGQVGMFQPANPTRTRTWRRASEAVKAFAKQTTIEEKANITGESKYSDEGSIKAKRQIFKNKALNAVDTFNKNAMEAEDWWFSKTAYQHTLQEYLTANGIKTEADIKNNPELVNKAKDYALAEAQRATFRQDSFVANKIAEIERKNPVYGAVIGSTMPFKKTPINIAKTGLAYSPLGIARNIYDAVQVKKGNMDASEAIDHVAQTFTGSALAMLGFVLADFGILNGAGEDDKEGDYDYQLGKQSYSFTFGGDTYSLSWLSPVAMPLFVGANFYEGLVEQKDWDANVVFDTLGQTLDPLSEMSFLSSLDDVLSSYDGGADRIFGAVGSMAQNYATQFIPTLSSQLASTFDDTKRSTKASKDSGFAFGEETVNKMLYKIPGLRNTLEPTTDIWGNEVKQTENFLARGFESFFSPANKRAGIYTAVDEEIKDLYRQTDDVGVIPAIPYNYINYDGEKYEMSANEHTEYKKLYGQTAYDLMSKLFDTNTYKNATSEERADMVNRVYDYARDEAKREYFSKYDVEYTNSTKDGAEVYKENTIKGAIEADMPVEEYTFYKEDPGKYRVAKAIGGYDAYKTYSEALNDLEADKDENGKSISGSRKEKVIDYINGLNIDYGQKIILLRSMYSSKEDRNYYNADIVEYLNSRNDITHSEMVSILKELEMTVHSDGRVTWD